MLLEPGAAGTGEGDDGMGGLDVAKYIEDLLLWGKGKLRSAARFAPRTSGVEITRVSRPHERSFIDARRRLADARRKLHRRRLDELDEDMF